MSGGFGEDTAAGDLIVPLHSRRRRRAQIAQKLQHAIPTIGLLSAAFQTLNSGTHGFELADHLIIGRRFFGTFKAPWDQIAEIAMTERAATIRTRQGKTRRLNLADLESAPAVRDALTRAQTRISRARLRSSRAELSTP